MDPIEFGRRWAEAWNAHDVEAVLAHFHDDVVFSSPLAAKLLPESGGVVRGKQAVREYWNKGLSLNPALRFTAEDVYAGVDIVVINFRNEQGVRRSEVLVFEGELVRAGYGTYLSEALSEA